MARPKESEVDSWTSNGKGVKMGPVSPERKKAIEKIEAERKAAAKKSPKKKK